jgi:hypothetical protein
MKSIYFPQNGGVRTEQNLVQQLIDEQIKLFGQDVYYLPRKIIQDVPLRDVVYSDFKTQYMIEMLLINVEGFGSPAEFVSKFGLRISDEVTFVVSKNRWSQVFQEFADITIIDGRPNEGDLIFFPLTDTLYEIKFVETKTPFFQLGETYIYTLSAEIYEIGNDQFETGIPEIDEVEELFSTSIELQMNTNQSGEYFLGETVTGQTTGVTGEVSYWNRDTDVLTIINRTGNFLTGEILLGEDSQTSRNISEVDNLSMPNNEYADNRYIEDAADGIIDWAEKNPFGEYGNFTTGDF